LRGDKNFHYYNQGKGPSQIYLQISFLLRPK
jgi:hypothetical protein